MLRRQRQLHHPRHHSQWPPLHRRIHRPAPRHVLASTSRSRRLVLSLEVLLPAAAGQVCEWLESMCELRRLQQLWQQQLLSSRSELRRIFWLSSRGLRSSWVPARYCLGRIRWLFVRVRSLPDRHSGRYAAPCRYGESALFPAVVPLVPHRPPPLPLARVASH